MVGTCFMTPFAIVYMGQVKIMYGMVVHVKKCLMLLEKGDLITICWL